MYLKVIGCSCYTCLPQSSPTAQNCSEDGSWYCAPPVAQCLLTIAMPKQVHNINIQANKSKH